jgi:hypothetical protein
MWLIIHVTTTRRSTQRRLSGNGRDSSPKNDEGPGKHLLSYRESVEDRFAGGYMETRAGCGLRTKAELVNADVQ